MTIQGRPHPVRLLSKRYSDPVDLALFFLDGQETGPTYQIAEKSPGFNEDAWTVGFPGRFRGRFRETRGQIERTNYTRYEYQFNRELLDGESGGPLFVNGFRVAGIVSASNTGLTLCTTVPKIRNFLTSVIGRVPNCGKPKEPAVQPSPGIAALLKRIAALEAKLKALESRQPQKGDRGERGPDGADGQAGDRGPQGVSAHPRTITLIIEDSSGNQLTLPVSIPPGKNTVRIPIERFERKEKGQ